LAQTALIEDALHLLDRGGGFVDWDRPTVQPIYDACLAFAHLAHHLAEQTGRCDPEAAWTCGLLAPLGWLAMCAVDPEAVAACLADPALRSDPAETQRRHWGIDHAAIARRLARRWRLPAWVSASAEHLHLPSELAQTFRADPVLFPLTRLAIEEARRQGLDLGLGNGAFSSQDRTALLISGDVDISLSRDPQGSAGSALPSGSRLSEISTRQWQEPCEVPLLRDLLELAAENRRLREQPLHDHLEREIDSLHRALEEQVHGEAQRLQSGKLAALAEFAAGAGHEINNPLAVISGQAQYLLNHQSDWFRDEAEDAPRQALEAIVAQTRRIHNILRELMQFAKPAPSCPGWLDLPALVGEVAASLDELGKRRRVRIEVALQPERLPVYADAGQLRTALTCLLRNAIEAAPTDGWARLVLRRPAAGQAIEVAVEDSGPGPDPAQLPHLFDPFYSGRTAGRGRGLGLPIAWRLSHLQGGDVRLDPPRRHEPTRFVLTLPHLSKPDSDAADAPLLHLPSANGRHAS
jgi:two-component system NtrC family sensor kinase